MFAKLPVQASSVATAALLAQAVAAPVFTATGGSGAGNDLFDVSNGVQVIVSTPAHNSCCGASDPRMAFGFGDLPPWVEPGTLIFADGPGAGFVDVLEWQTPAPVTLTHVEIRLSEDGAGNPFRGASAYRLLASQDGQRFFQISGANIPLSDGAMKHVPLRIADAALTGATTNLRAFRLELTRLSDGGPRLVEVDGFGTSGPVTGEFLDRLAFNAASNALTGRAGATFDDESPGLAFGFAASGRHSGADQIEDAFGNRNGPLEPDTLLFADGGVPDPGNGGFGERGETVDFVSWSTAVPLRVAGYRLTHGGSDGGVVRDLRRARLFVNEIEQDAFAHPGGAAETVRRFPGGPVEGDRFRLEFTRRTAAGPRLVEIDALLAPPLPTPPLTNGVVLNEIVAVNDESATDEDADSPAWLELFNASEVPATIEGWGLSDDPERPYRWTFPRVTLAARAHLRVFASGKDRTNSVARLHTSFRIDPDGEPLILTRPDGTRADTAPPARLRRDVSLGRLPDGDGPWKFLATPTPGRANHPQHGYESLVFDPPQFSPPGGFHPARVALTLTALETNTVVRFTLDSSEPTESSARFEAPLEIASRAGQPNVLSLIRGTSTANQHTDGWKTPLGEVRKSTVVRARAFRPGALPGPVVTHTYFVGADAVRSDGLPTLSIVSPTNGLFDYYQGIYMLGAIFDQYVAAHPGEQLTGHTPANYTQRGPAWERDAHVEFFAPDGTRAWSEPVKLDIQGQSSRSFRQKSFGLKARGDSGEPNTIEYPLFPGLRRLGDGTLLAEFRHLRLRNAGNDWDVAMLRDDWCHRLVGGLGLDLMSSRPVAIHLDGEYWGVLAAREQQDPQYLREHYGLDPAEAVILYGDGSLEEGRSGDDQPFRSLRQFASTHDLATPAYYSYVRSRLDLDNFLIYQLCEIYFANADWPQNNMRVWRRRLSTADLAQPRGLDGRWRWFLFDVDLGVGHPWSVGYTENTLAIAVSPTGRPGFDTGWATAFLRALLRNPDFKRDFYNTAADLLNSWFLESRAVALVDAMEAELRPAMDEHLRRWRSCGGSVNAWRQRVQGVRAFAQNRAAQMRQHCASALAPSGTARLTLDVAPPATGRIRVNRLTVDTNLPGVAATPYPWRGTYFRTVPITLEALPAPGHRFAGWVGLDATGRLATVTLTNALSVTARFEPAPQDFRPLMLTEIDYHPPPQNDVDGDLFEFIELKNTGAEPLELGGLAFSGAISFAFTHGTVLAPAGFLVLANRASHLATRFPGVAVHGEYTGRLDNAGETLALGYPGGPLLFSLSYDDAWPWPTDADGRGSSLQRVNRLEALNEPSNWCAAPPTPGADTPAAFLDRDGDGLPDLWETAHQLDPDNPLDAAADPDADGLTNDQEFHAGTDPRDPASALRFDRIQLTEDGTALILQFAAHANVACSVQRSPAPGGVWSEIAWVPPAPSTRTISITNRVDSVGAFYRLAVPWPR